MVDSLPGWSRHSFIPADMPKYDCAYIGKFIDKKEGKTHYVITSSCAAVYIGRSGEFGHLIDAEVGVDNAEAFKRAALHVQRLRASPNTTEEKELPPSPFSKAYLIRVYKGDMVLPTTMQDGAPCNYRYVIANTPSIMVDVDEKSELMYIEVGRSYTEAKAILDQRYKFETQGKNLTIM